MYKYLLCWRYLRTRYIALASVVSVMLGVATMIVVNSVMAGFADKMRTRIHGILADVVVEARSIDGFYNVDEVIERIKRVGGDRIVATAPTMEVFGLLKFRLGAHTIPRQVMIIGVDPVRRAQTGDFAKFLVDDKGNTIEPSFNVSKELKENSPAGMVLKEWGSEEKGDAIDDLLKEHMNEQVPDHGAIIGYALGTYHRKGATADEFIIKPGAKIGLIFPQAGTKIQPGYDDFTVVGYFKSGMSEYDSTHVYVPIERFQYLRMLQDAQGRGAVNQIQIKVRSGVDLDTVASEIQDELDKLEPGFFIASTWEQKQGALLSAVAIEQSILNMLLFFIIAVAGFGILGIFFMIVIEKMRDIGIMKALGASTSGVRAIFLGYGLLLGTVGSGVGMVAGLLFVYYINTIEGWLSRLTGRKVFDGDIYYFNEIPTVVEPLTVLWIVGGALFIAAAASVWPAHRAAKLHPVRALRFE